MILSGIWSIDALHAKASLDLLAYAVKAGPVDDAERYGLPVQRSGSTALVSTKGPMIKSAGWLQRYGIAGTRDTQNALLSARDDAEIENIVWIMDTPGGSVDALAELSDVVENVAAVKPVYVQVDGLLASAGYYVAAKATGIYAGFDNLIGSIGTRTYMIDTSKMYEDMGVKVIPIDTGEHKSAGMDGTVITDAQIEETQRIVNGYFKSFLDVVEQGRKIPRAELEKLADGRVFFAQESVQNGLIDGVRTLRETLEAINNKKVSSRSARARMALVGV